MVNEVENKDTLRNNKLCQRRCFMSDTEEKTFVCKLQFTNGEERIVYVRNNKYFTEGPFKTDTDKLIFRCLDDGFPVPSMEKLLDFYIEDFKWKISNIIMKEN